MNPLISIIIPVYNSEHCLRQCLESIRQQSYHHIEIIIVVDGATDNSLQIAHSFCKEDKRFLTISQPNQGSGIARNTGIAMANGVFMAFVDPDDLVSVDYIESLYLAQIENDADLVIGGYETILAERDKENKHIRTINPVPVVLRGESDVRHKFIELFGDELIFSPWAKLYRTQIIKDNHVLFPEFRRSQDIVFNYRYYDHIRSLQITPYAGYIYRVEYVEQIKRVDKQAAHTIAFIYNEIKALHKKWNIETNEQALATSLLGLVLILCENKCYRLQGLQDVLNNSILQEIVHSSSPASFPQKIFRHLFCKKHQWLLAAMTYSKILTKKGMKRI